MTCGICRYAPQMKATINARNELSTFTIPLIFLRLTFLRSDTMEINTIYAYINIHNNYFPRNAAKIDFLGESGGTHLLLKFARD